MSDGSSASEGEPGGGGVPEFRSGFVALTGRPNTGKSTLLNRIVDRKVSIVSDKAQTTRQAVRGVLNRPGVQVVMVDTPGISKPRTALGSRLNESAVQARSDVDATCMVVDGRSGLGRGDRFIAEKLDPATTIGVLNKIDGLPADRVMAQLQAFGELGFADYFPVSAFTGKGVGALVEHLLTLMPSGPQWYPDGMTTDTGEREWVAELVREQLFHLMRDEVPHSVATRVTEWAWPRIRVEILVERNSQKGIVIGNKGSVLKEVGSRVRKQLPEGAFLELVVNVDPNWQHDRSAVERLGY
ncbi:MAG: GTPase Era [Actinomycetota bacterium]